MNNRKIAFVEIRNEENPANAADYGYKGSREIIDDLYGTLRPYFNGVIIGNGNQTPITGEQGLKNN